MTLPAFLRRAAKANQLPVDRITEVRAAEDPGPVLTALYPVPGGTAQLYERGVLVNRAGSEVIIEFRLPSGSETAAKVGQRVRGFGVLELAGIGAGQLGERGWDQR
jgi:hypothetical protein